VLSALSSPNLNSRRGAQEKHADLAAAMLPPVGKAHPVGFLVCGWKACSTGGVRTTSSGGGYGVRRCGSATEWWVGARLRSEPECGTL
jgi:hypothetical protein